VNIDEYLSLSMKFKQKKHVDITPVIAISLKYEAHTIAVLQTLSDARPKTTVRDQVELLA